MEQVRGSHPLVGSAMIGAAAATVVTMLFHPSHAHAGGLARSVHALMILWLMLLTLGFSAFALGRGIQRPLILAGLLSYLVSLGAHVGAATINGFIVPALANPAAPPVSHDLFRLLWHSNQALAKLGVYLTGAAYLAFGADLLRADGRSRILGWLGIAAGAVPAALLAFGAIRMDVHGALLVYATHAGWAALVGWPMIGGDQPRE